MQKNYVTNSLENFYKNKRNRRVLLSVVMEFKVQQNQIICNLLKLIYK